ncbi:hypothetical protein UFOVP250_62 [uncultured Caudovirales phage]|uniref:Uncharacterized protein n=1 Tax=uncultured Caudovirales phage TaxID=2100421 RepID=A0A6J5LEU7_9CAUD|nr:hypothetical protein UFOVP250_62 [uncultured Caudovirales phage]
MARGQLLDQDPNMELPKTRGYNREFLNPTPNRNNGECGLTQREHSVTELTQDIEARLDMLYDAMNTLDIRLDTILRPNFPETIGNPIQDPVLPSELCYKQYNILRRVEGLIEFTNKLTDRINL